MSRVKKTFEALCFEATAQGDILIYVESPDEVPTSVTRSQISNLIAACVAALQRKEGRW